MNPTIEVNQVSKSFGKTEVLNNINLAMEKGQIYGLIGPSGAGKTTLVKMIVGMDKATKGSIKVLDQQMPNLRYCKILDIWRNQIRCMKS